MKFIHTSDWHLGKMLEGHSRMEEQEKFCDEFVSIVEREDLKLVIIAGDIYDTYNPSAQAEKLFYKTVSRLADNGRRCIFIVAGNHDNPDRLTAAVPLALEQGIIILGKPGSKTEVGVYKNFQIKEAKEGYTKIKIGEEEVGIISLPYPSEKRLNDIIDNNETESDRQRSYSEKIGDIFKELENDLDTDIINIAVSHIFVVGGESSDSERPIQLGGSLLVEKKHLPQKADYIALGHLHKSQKVSERLNAYYSGSPIQYSKDERMYKKGANIVEIKAGGSPDINRVLFENYRPIEVFKCDGIKEAIDICEQNSGKEMWSFFEIITDEVIDQSDLKTMKELLGGIIEIKPVINRKEDRQEIDIKEKSMGELFRDFYIHKKGVEPKGELMDLFLDIVNEEGEY